MSTTTQPTIRLSDLPAIGKPLDGGHFAGITTNSKGQHYAVVLLPEQGTTTKTCLSCGASVTVREDGTVVGGALGCGH